MMIIRDMIKKLTASIRVYEEQDENCRCSFCGRKAARLIASPSGVYICEDCVDVCMDLFEDDEEPDVEIIRVAV